MTEKELKELNNIKWEIDNLKNELSDIKEIIDYYDEFGSDISFTRNRDSRRRSFGSKKHNIKKDLKLILIRIQKEKTEELERLKHKFETL